MHAKLKKMASKDNTSEGPQGVIEVTKIHTVKLAEDVTGVPCSFHIVTPERVYFLVGDSQEDANEWTRAIGRAIVMHSSVLEE